MEWAHAIAPVANILLVEASSASFSDLLTAVDYARNAAGVVAVSMSWGGGEFSGESGYDGYFTTPSGHGGVTFVAASGDSGAPVGYPAISPNVVAVGGTTLSLGAGGNYLSESGWSGSSGGLSAYEAEPAYQRTVVTQTSTFRANPDVAYDSNPNTGFSVYDSYNNPVSAPWGQWGGTSDAAPQWAALVAIADQGRAAGRQGVSGRRHPDPAHALLALQRRLPRHHQRHEHRQPHVFGRAGLRSGDRPGQPRGQSGGRRPGGRRHHAPGKRHSAGRFRHCCGRGRRRRTAFSSPTSRAWSLGRPRPRSAIPR